MSEEPDDATRPLPDAPAALPPTAMTYACPNCGQSVLVSPPPVNGIVQCPYCNTQFFCAASAEDEPGIDDEDEAADREEMLGVENQLDGSKIQQHAALRRSIYRSRSHALIGAGACAVLTVQLGLMAVREFLRSGANTWSICYAILAASGVWGMVHWTLSATELTREAKLSALQEPARPPDFSPLSDGSQQAKNLDKIGE